MCTRYDVGTCARERAYLHGWRTRASTCSARRACPCMHAPDLNSLCIAPQALKVDPKGLPTLPAHPPNIRPYDDYFTEHRAKFLERHTRPTTGAAADGANRTSGGRMPADESFWDKAMKNCQGVTHCEGVQLPAVAPKAQGPKKYERTSAPQSKRPRLIRL